MIEVNHISYHYHSGKDVLKDVSFTLEQGQFLAILGNNGVGWPSPVSAFSRSRARSWGSPAPIWR